MTFRCHTVAIIKSKFLIFKLDLGYLKNSNAERNSVDSNIFTQRFIYNFMHDDVSMARLEQGS